MKESLLCPSCGRRVKFEELAPEYEKKSILVPKPKLLCYVFRARRCYKCKKSAEFNKDYVRELWQEQHPTLKVIKKL